MAARVLVGGGGVRMLRRPERAFASLWPAGGSPGRGGGSCWGPDPWPLQGTGGRSPCPQTGEAACPGGSPERQTWPRGLSACPPRRARSQLDPPQPSEAGRPSPRLQRCRRRFPFPSAPEAGLGPGSRPCSSPGGRAGAVGRMLICISSFSVLCGTLDISWSSSPQWS